MIRRRTARRDGLTLLEVLVALAIFLLSLVAVAGLVDAGAAAGLAAGMQSTGTRLAQSKLAEVEAGVVSPSESSSGTCDGEPNWSYAIDSAAAGPANVYTVTVTCTRVAGGRTYSVALTQMICDPAQMGTAGDAVNPAAATTSGTTSGGTSGTSSGGGS